MIKLFGAFSLACARAPECNMHSTNNPPSSGITTRGRISCSNSRNFIALAHKLALRTVRAGIVVMFAPVE
jgi:hypothetical protein